MDTIQRQKAALRRELAAAERAMMPEEKRLSDSAILHHVLNTQEYRLAARYLPLWDGPMRSTRGRCWSRY